MRVQRYQLSYAKSQIAESKALERQLASGGMRVLGPRGDRMVDVTEETITSYRWQRRWAIQRARWALRDLRDAA